ncbi:MAG TPA: hypothetical protein VKV17_10825 [Bryobacteraceae bacterium]|nr:hypothetical protein [Bryobacteraceae bacterium]
MSFGGGSLPSRHVIYSLLTVIGNWFLAFVLLGAMVNRPLGPANILTANGDNYRTNSNLEEAQLTPANVRPGSFGKLGSFATDGQVYAQPLYVSNLLLADGKRHNVVFLATMHNSVYAYDADQVSGAAPLWKINLGPSVPVSLWNSSYTDISPEVGILGTGAIDPQTNVLYVVAEILQNGTAAFTLHALNLLDGSEAMNGPVTIHAGASGSGAGSVGGQLVFNPVQHLQRPGLLLTNQSVYVAFGSHMDQSPWHGWVISYRAADLRVEQGAFLTTANGEGGAIWHSGRGLAADDAGNIYAMTGNGDFDGSTNFAESFLKLSGAAATLADWFTPANWQALTDVDADLSTGPIVIPGTHTLVGGDKFGQLYLVNGDWMGKLGTENSPGAVILPGAVIGGMFNFALWNQSSEAYLYVQGEQDAIKCYRITAGAFEETPVSAGTAQVASPRVGLTISANGVRNGILWETTGDSNPGTLHAFDAANLSNELWNSDMSPGDTLGSFMKFANPTVANGKVYVGTGSGSVVVYGLTCANGRSLKLAGCTSY